jgi:hypothetical protein
MMPGGSAQTPPSSTSLTKNRSDVVLEDAVTVRRLRAANSVEPQQKPTAIRERHTAFAQTFDQVSSDRDAEDALYDS